MLTSSLVYLRDPYEKARFKIQAKYGMLRWAAMEDNKLYDFLLIEDDHKFNVRKYSIA